ncbi:MAG: hypothetical protein FJ104_15235, partial [Deltaproteobacteria bacterium]|nr:hypothetical protein [Deltaproteobacteria bacterium]
TALTKFRETLIPTKQYAGQFGAATAPDYPTTFLSLRGYYSGACARGAAGGLSLQVSYTPPAGAPATSQVDLEKQLMHLLDYSFPMGDLLDVVGAKIDARP